ncbi:hypothetical protein [Zoogloea sp. LCSB751]|uniref:hypothetical protein n=1 Tax=Zoogloea sp. LCSB751 TaxID=1965277 RepID=UPI00111737C6|nr:hypothetical protein [Zoogloea sp. LCSB751]
MELTISNPPFSRFVWGQGAPTPFESSWLIFLKMMALNNCTFNHVFKYLCADTYCRQDIENPLKVVSVFDSKWVDFQKFSRALGGVSERSLRAAFLSELAFPLQYRFAIRHCPECIGNGYHSVFFQINSLERCPWHGHELVLCSCCSSALGQGFKSQGGKSCSAEEWSFSLKCGHVVIEPVEVPFVLSPTPEFRDLVLNTSKTFLKWWRRVLNNEGHPNLSLGLIVISIDGGYLRDVDLKLMTLGHAKHLGGPCPWPITDSDIGFRSCVWEDCGEIRHSSGDWRTVMKSIRRHIFRRYVRRHRGCYGRLAKLSTLASHALNGKSVCFCALSFILWRMEFEGFSKVGPWHNNKNSVEFADRFPEEDSLKQKAYSVYMAFFMLWWQLYSNSPHRKVSIVLAKGFVDRDYYRSIIRIKSRKNTQIFQFDDPAESECKITYALMPIPEELSRKESKNCILQRKDENLFSLAGGWSVSSWAYAPAPEIMARLWPGHEVTRVHGIVTAVGA